MNRALAAFALLLIVLLGGLAYLWTQPSVAQQWLQPVAAWLGIDVAERSSVRPASAPQVPPTERSAPVATGTGSKDTPPVHVVGRQAVATVTVDEAGNATRSVPAGTDLSVAEKPSAAPVGAIAGTTVDVETAGVASTTAGTAPVETAMAESATSESAKLESATAESAKLESATAETAKLESATAESAKLESATAETASIETATGLTAAPISVSSPSSVEQNPAPLALIETERRVLGAIETARDPVAIPVPASADRESAKVPQTVAPDSPSVAREPAPVPSVAAALAPDSTIAATPANTPPITSRPVQVESDPSPEASTGSTAPSTEVIPAPAVAAAAVEAPQVASAPVIEAPMVARPAAMADLTAVGEATPVVDPPSALEAERPLPAASAPTSPPAVADPPFASASAKPDTVAALVPDTDHDSGSAAKTRFVAEPTEASAPITANSGLLSPEQLAMLVPPSATPARPRTPAARSQQSEIQRLLSDKRVAFEIGRTVLTPAGRQTLDDLVPILLAHGETVVTIQGHTDSVGDQASNLELSGARAIVARDYLAARGVPSSRLRVQGFGELRPIASNSTPEGRIRNRRIDFAISDAR